MLNWHIAAAEAAKLKIYSGESKNNSRVPLYLVVVGKYFIFQVKESLSTTKLNDYGGVISSTI